MDPLKMSRNTQVPAQITLLLYELLHLHQIFFYYEIMSMYGDDSVHEIPTRVRASLMPDPVVEDQ